MNHSAMTARFRQVTAEEREAAARLLGHVPEQPIAFMQAPTPSTPASPGHTRAGAHTHTYRTMCTTMHLPVPNAYRRCTSSTRPTHTHTHILVGRQSALPLPVVGLIGLCRVTWSRCRWADRQRKRPGLDRCRKSPTGRRRSIIRLTRRVGQCFRLVPRICTPSVPAGSL